MAYLQREPKGIGGSLLLFLGACLMAAIYGGREVVWIFHLHAYFSEKMGGHLSWGFLMFGWVMSWTQAILPLLVAALMLWVRRPITPRIALAAIWILFGLFPAISVMTALTDIVRLPGNLAEVSQNLACRLVVAVVATAYILTSQRVANTFRPGAEIEGVFD